MKCHHPAIDRRESVALFAELTDSPVKSFLTMNLTHTIDRMSLKRPSTSMEWSPVCAKRQCKHSNQENTPPQKRDGAATAPVRRGMSPLRPRHWRRHPNRQEEQPARRLEFGDVGRMRSQESSRRDSGYFKRLFYSGAEGQAGTAGDAQKEESTAGTAHCAQDCEDGNSQIQTIRESASTSRRSSDHMDIETDEDSAGIVEMTSKRKGAVRAPAQKRKRQVRNENTAAAAKRAPPKSRVAMLRGERAGGYKPTPRPVANNSRACSTHARSAIGRKAAETRSERIDRRRNHPSVFSQQYARPGSVRAKRRKRNDGLCTADRQQAALLDKVLDVL